MPHFHRCYHARRLPLSLLPDTLRDITLFEPLTQVVIAVQHPWSGHGWNTERLAIPAAITIMGGAFTLWRFGWS